MERLFGIVPVVLLIGTPVQAVCAAIAGGTSPPPGGGKSNDWCSTPAAELIGQHVHPKSSRQALRLSRNIAQVLPVPVRQQQHNATLATATAAHKDGGQARRGGVCRSPACAINATATAAATRVIGAVARRTVHLTPA